METTIMGYIGTTIRIHSFLMVSGFSVEVLGTRFKVSEFWLQGLEDV